jgi:hypothetical protein
MDYTDGVKSQDADIAASLRASEFFAVFSPQEEEERDIIFTVLMELMKRTDEFIQNIQNIPLAIQHVLSILDVILSTLLSRLRRKRFTIPIRARTIALVKERCFLEFACHYPTPRLIKREVSHARM